MVRFHRLHVSPKAEQHIWERHRLAPWQAREAFEDAGRKQQVFRGPNSTTGGRTYIARGRTQDGLPLWVLVKDLGQGIASLITAREDR